MKYSLTDLITLLFSEPGKFTDAFMADFHHLLSIMSAYIAPIKQDLIWIIPAILVTAFLLFFMLKTIVKRIKKGPVKSDEDEATSADSKPERPAEPEKPEPMPEPETPQKPSFIRNIRTGLSKTRDALSSGVDALFSQGGKLDDDMLEELEEMLITSDVGVKTSLDLIEKLSERSNEITSAQDLKNVMRKEVLSYINIDHQDRPVLQPPKVIMVVGVNGVGKTTTIGKLSARFAREGKKVLIVAADTFRAAASDQLTLWAERAGADIVKHKDNSDPAAVAYDGMAAAIARKADVVIIDTAGRLHTKKNLMEELKKIERTVSGHIDGAPHETLMVVDATTGQNSLTQAQLFNEAIGISAIALTKLDGTAKGGIVIGITSTLNVPLKYIGVGEQIEDLQDFDPVEFVDALF